MPKASKELVSTPTDAQQLHDQKTRNAQTFVSRESPLTTFIDNPNSTDGKKLTDNSLNLTPGEHPGLIVDTSTSILGVPGATILPSLKGTTSDSRVRSFLVNTDNVVVHVSGLHFLGLVYVGRGQSNNLATAPTVIFENCIFEVSVTNFGKTHLIGCEFREPSFGSVINQSNPTDCYIIGCSNKGVAHFGAPTIIAETT